MSTCEAEFKALAEAVKEAMYLQKLIQDMKIPVDKQMKIFVDNQAAITISENPALHKRTKHISANFNFVREAIREDKVIRLQHINTENNTADIFTKPLIGNKFHRHVRSMLVKYQVEEEC